MNLLLNGTRIGRMRRIFLIFFGVTPSVKTKKTRKENQKNPLHLSNLCAIKCQNTEGVFFIFYKTLCC